MNNNQISNFIKKERDRKIRNIVCNLIIFLFSITILTGLTTQHLIVFGQNNQNSSSAADDVDVTQSFPTESKGEQKNNQDTEQLTSDNTTSSNSVSNSSKVEYNNEQNTNNDSTKSTREILVFPSLTEIVYLILLCQSVLQMKMVDVLKDLI